MGGGGKKLVAHKSLDRLQRMQIDLNRKREMAKKKQEESGEKPATATRFVVSLFHFFFSKIFQKHTKHLSHKNDSFFSFSSPAVKTATPIKTDGSLSFFLISSKIS